MKIKSMSIAALSAFAFAGPASAATIIASNTTSDGTNVSVYALTGTGTNVVANDGTNYAWDLNFFLAQSFSTGTLGTDNKLSTISVGTVGDTTASTLTAVLYKNTTVDGNYLGAESSPVASATVNVSAATGPTTITFDFSSSNVTLSDNSVYAFYLKPDSGQQSFTWAGSSSSSSYAGGEAMVVWEANLPNPGFWHGDGIGATGDITGDRVFTVTAVPEPSAALIGGLGLLALLRRRR